MSVPAPSRQGMADGPARNALAASLGAQLTRVALADFTPAAADKVRTCLYDLIGCALEAADKPWSRQARAVTSHADPARGACAQVIGAAGCASPADAAFVNAVMGHGLVREDMHAASISHLGVAVVPTLLALAQTRKVSGADLMAAAIAGYEVGAQIGRALMDANLARIFRPTGITGPLAGAAAGARLLRLDAQSTTHALALAANTSSGFNQWAHTGGSEMYFHAGNAARSAVTSVLLAQAGAFASPSALDGEAGLFAAHGKREAAARVRLFDGEPQILAVYQKPVPACNFAQSACQAALRLAVSGAVPAARIRSVQISVPSAGAAYPGCDFVGPFDHALQAKMSIQYNVAAALLTGRIEEANFDLLQDAALMRLVGLSRLQVDAGMSAAYPAQQGGAVQVVLDDGTRHEHRLDDVVNATAQDVRRRFRAAALPALGERAVASIEGLIDTLEHCEDAGRLPAALRPAAGGA